MNEDTWFPYAGETVTDVVTFHAHFCDVLDLLNAVYPGTKVKQATQPMRDRPIYLLGDITIYLDLSHLTMYVVRPYYILPLENELFVKMLFDCDVYFDQPSGQALRKFLNEN